MTKIKVRVIDCHIAYYNDKKSDWEFLLLKRSKDIPNQRYPGIWQGVTGKIENSEFPYKTALRELMEETGLKADKLWTIDQVNTFYDAEENIMTLVPVFGVAVNSINVLLSKEQLFRNIRERVKKKLNKFFIFCELQFSFLFLCCLCLNSLRLVNLNSTGLLYYIL